MNAEIQSNTNHRIGERLASIDVLRGFDMFFLVGAGDIVRRFLEGLNSEAMKPLYAQFKHAEWIGFTAWDIIMPLFLFTSGLSMPFSIGKLLKQGCTKSKIYTKILKRFCLLFLFGWIVQGNLLDLNYDTFHLYCNTLHAIAVGYLITALLALNIPKASMQLLICSSFLFIYWALLSFCPVPGIGSGVLTPDGNIAIYIDRTVMGHFQSGGYSTWILTTFGFAATVFSGYYAGLMLKKSISPERILKQLSLTGIALIAGGLLWSLQMPIIKVIWTPSMVLFSSGICYLLLACSYFLTDKLKISSWWTYMFKVLGMNAIAAYLLNAVFGLNQTSALLLRGFEQYIGVFFPFIVALGKYGIIYFILHQMYQYKIFLKV